MQHQLVAKECRNLLQDFCSGALGDVFSDLKLRGKVPSIAAAKPAAAEPAAAQAEQGQQIQPTSTVPIGALPGGRHAAKSSNPATLQNLSIS